MAVWVSVLAVLVVTAGSYVYAHRQNTQSYRSDVRSCERGNLIRERINLIGIEVGLHLEPLPIVDCPATVR